MPKEFNFMACFEVIILQNRIESALQVKNGENFNEKKKKVQQMTFRFF